MDTPEIERLRAKIADLTAQLDAARDALLAEQFRDVPRYSEGDIVLVSRKLFGKTRPWPARIADVHLNASSGTDAYGRAWETRTVSYGVYYQQPDGLFGGSSHGYYHSEVQPVPAGESKR